MKLIHISPAFILALSLVGCGASSHYMQDDVYATRTPVVPLGTDMRDETDYAVYAYKREHTEENVQYTNNTNRNWQNNTRFGFGTYSMFPGSGFYMGYSTYPYFAPGYYAYNSYPYYEPTYGGYSPYMYGQGMYVNYYGNPYFNYGMNYGAYSPFGYSAWGNPYYNNYYNYYGYNNYYGGGYYGNYVSYHSTEKPFTGMAHTSAGTVTRSAIPSPNVNYGNQPRMIRANTNRVDQAVTRTTVSGPVSNGGTSPRRVATQTAVNNTPIRPAVPGSGGSGTNPVNNGRPSVERGNTVNNRVNTNDTYRTNGTIRNSSQGTSPSNGGSVRTSSPGGGNGGGVRGGSTGSSRGNSGGIRR